MTKINDGMNRLLENVDIDSIDKEKEFNKLVSEKFQIIV